MVKFNILHKEKTISIYLNVRKLGLYQHTVVYLILGTLIFFIIILLKSDYLSVILRVSVNCTFEYCIVSFSLMHIVTDSILYYFIGGKTCPHLVWKIILNKFTF